MRKSRQKLGKNMFQKKRKKTLPNLKNRNPKLTQSIKYGAKMK